MKVSVSVGISPRQSFQSWIDLVVALEERGVDRVWLIDSQLAMKDVYIGLALAATRTARIQLGTGVTNALTRHPTVTANSIAAVSELSDGRALLGLGAGDSAVYGLGWKPSKVAEMEATVRFLEDVLHGREGTLDGRQYALPHLAAPVPVYVAVSQRRMCNLAGRLADGAIVMGPAQPDYVRSQVEWISSGAREAGRKREDVEISLITTMSANEDPARALEDVRSWASTEARLLADFANLPSALERFRPEIDKAKADYDYSQHLSTHAGHQGTVSDELARTLAVAGTPEECAARLRDLLAAGVDNFIFPLLGGGRLERLRLIKEEVLPRVERGQIMV